MDSGVAAFLGALLGALASLGGIVIKERLQADRAEKIKKPKKELLTDMLNGDRKWRKLSTLANVTGMTDPEAKQLLVEIGARGSETDPSLWGLVTRNPLPTHDVEPNDENT